MGNPIAQGASTIYEGSKNVIINGANYVKNGTVKITPTAANVAKTLGKGVAGVAVSVVVDELLGAVDWVLDPANNRIKYYETSQDDPSLYQYLWAYTVNSVRYYAVSPEAACHAQYAGKNGTWNGNGSYTTQNEYKCGAANYVKRVINPAYNPDADREEKYLPLDVFATQVISNAASGDASAQAATTAAAADIVSEAAADQTGVKARPIVQQLESSASTKPAEADAAATANTATGTQTQNPTKPETKDIALEFPTFCGWAPTLCEFAQTATQSIADAKAEYADKPQENKDTELEIPDPEEPTIDSDISFGGSCPAPLTSQVNFMGINETIEFSFDNVCEIAQFIKPVVISVSAFSAALIVAGIRTEDD